MSAGAGSTPAVPSPCVRNCCLDGNDICLGCFRSLTEICAWANSTPEQKQEILERCRARREEYGRGAAAPPRAPW